MRFLNVLFVLCLLAGFPAASVATGMQDRVTADKTRLALAGRQRMLTQKITKAACLARLNPNTGAHSAEAERALTAYKTALKTLISGDPALGLEPEVSPAVLSALADMSHASAAFERALEHVLQTAGCAENTRETPQDLAVLAESSEAALKAAQAVTQQVVRFRSSSGLHPAKSKTLDLAGRQRMLTQRIAKQVCFIASGYDVSASVTALTETQALFNATLTVLRYGDYDTRIPGPATLVVRDTLDQFMNDWSHTDARLSAAAANSTVSIRDASALTWELGNALTTSQEIVNLY